MNQTSQPPRILFGGSHRHSIVLVRAACEIIMAEALDITEAVIGVIQISEQIVSACYHYYLSVKDAKRDILAVIDIVGSLKTTLDNLRLLLEHPSNLPNVHCLKGPLKACESTLQKLSTNLDVQFGPDATEPDKNKVTLLRKLFWPWKKTEVGKLLDAIEKYKATFILALAADTLRETLEVMESIEAITVIATKQLKSTILAWLKRSDPSTNHSAARDKHEPTTGDWFLDSPTLSSWTKESVKSVWLYGIPGAGKTVLCSTIIERVKELCSVQSRHRVAYFYFDFNDPDKCVVVGMLRSFIVQLCAEMEQLPDEVFKLYHENGDGTQQPGKERLIETLLAVIATCTERTYLIVDALDECGEWKSLLDLITRLMENNLPESDIDIRVLVTSRKEKGIAEILDCSFDKIINLEGEGIDQDIKHHVSKCLECDVGLQKWPHPIRIEIHDALLNGAHGM
jgi:hypothetical protein